MNTLRNISLNALVAAGALLAAAGSVHAQCAADWIYSGDGAADDRFAYAMCMSGSPNGTRLIAGAPFHDYNANRIDAGMAYVFSITGNQVFQVTSFDMTGPWVAASAVLSLGSGFVVTAATELALTPPARPSRSLAIAAAVAAVSSWRPSFAGATPTIVPPRDLR